MEYLIEELGRDNRWSILGSAKTSGTAQLEMWSYQRLFPRTEFRVVESPSRRLITLSGTLARA